MNIIADKIKVEAVNGSDIVSSVKDTIAICTLLQCEADLTFNGIQLLIKSTSTISELLVEFDNKFSKIIDRSNK